MRTLALLPILFALPAGAAMVQKPVTYEHDGVTFESVLVYDDAIATPRPGLVLVPNWMGVNAANLEQAALVAGQRYVVLVADVYGASVRPKNAKEASEAAGALKANRPLLRARAAKALEQLVAQKSAPLDTTKTGAIGFCFGGTTALELARAGAPVGGVVSFHGGLDTPHPEQTKKVGPRVLVLHGADDPAVPDEQVQGFIDEMRAAKADWQLVSFGGAVHSFTDPHANTPGRSQYHPEVAARAYELMHGFFREVFAR